jgi:hypothetical protein
MQGGKLHVMVVETGNAFAPSTGISPLEIEFQPLGESFEGVGDPGPSIPKRGSYSTDPRTMDRGRDQSSFHHPMEINFSPGGSSMTTAEVPRRGSFVGDMDAVDETTVCRSHSEPHEYQSRAEKEVNFSPATGGAMETTGAPKQGSFVLKRKHDEDGVRRKAVDEEYAEEVVLQEEDLARWKSQKAAQARLKANHELQSTGAIPTPKTSNKGSVRINSENSSDNLTRLPENGPLHPGSSPNTEGGAKLGCYVGDVNERPLNHISRSDDKEEIQFQPEGYLPVEPHKVPKQGSFVDKSTSGQIVTTGRGSSMAQREINFSPGASEMEAVAVPKAGSYYLSYENVENKKTIWSDSPPLSSMKLREAGQSEDLEDETVTVSNKAEITSAVQTTKEHSYTPDASILAMEAMLDAALNDDVFEDKDESFSFATGERTSADASELSSKIPSAAFLKMGAALCSQNDSSAILDALLDGDEGVEEDTVRGRQYVATSANDEHDDLLDSMLGDDDVFDERSLRSGIQQCQPDELLDSVLDGDVDLGEVNGNTKDTKDIARDDEFLPNESILELEAILDDGFEKLGHPDHDHCRLEDPGNPDMMADDSMAQELDALLDGDLNEEVEIDFETAPHKSSSGNYFAASERFQRSKGASLGNVTDEREAAMNSRRQSSVHGNVKDAVKNNKVAGVVSRLFNSRGSKKGEPLSSDTTKTKSSFLGSRTLKTRPDSSTSVHYERTKKVDSPPKIDVVRKKVDTGGNKTSIQATTAKKSFMASTFSSAGRFGRKSEAAVEQSVQKAPSVKDKKTRIKGSFMASTFASNRKASEISIIETEKAKEKEREAKKIIVNLRPWRRKENCAPVLNTSIRSPVTLPEQFHIGSKPEFAIPGNSSSGITLHFDPTETPNRSPQNSVFSPRSYASLSSQCTVTSFASPRKLGIRGCQSKYDPYHHKQKGPCELCVFRLSEAEKETLDTKGRHFMVQFTTGGCTNCQVFPKDFDEPTVRLCPKCYSISHREATKNIKERGISLATRLQKWSLDDNRGCIEFS